MSIPGEKATRRDPCLTRDQRWKRRRCIYDMDLKLQERKDGIDRMKESLFKYLGMSVIVANASSTAV